MRRQVCKGSYMRLLSYSPLQMRGKSKIAIEWRAKFDERLREELQLESDGK